jgi:threonine 3-dehydrogenase
MSKMKVLSKLKAEPGIWMSEADIPKIGSNEVLIKIKKTAICGTDLHIYKWDEWAQKTIPVPMHVGHEFMGEIVEIGSEVKGFKVGDRVSGEGHITCGHCRNCRGGRTHLCRNTFGVGVNRPGCFAEFLAIPAFNAFKIPDDISDDLASIFDPFGNAVHTALSFDLVGEDILITGAGPIGMMAAAICRHVGARHIVITDVNDYRLNLALDMGATKAVNVKDCQTIEQTTQKLKEVMQELKMTEGYDVGLEISGFQTAIAAMINTMNNGGRLALLGLAGKEVSVDWNTIIFRGLFLKGIYGREMFETWYKMASLLQSGLDISKVITHHFKAKDYIKAFETVKSGQCGKVILDWD